MAPQDTSEIREFFDAQETYVTVIRENYLQHREIVHWVLACCKRRFGHPIRILELGCGDAYLVSRLIEDIAVASYTGIDLSANALDSARASLSERVPDVTLIQGDIVAEIRSIRGVYDLILAGYMLHHLQHAVKAKVLSALSSRVAMDGILILYDVTMAEGDTRETYHERSLAHFDAHWSALSRGQFGEVRKHILAYDFPESREGWIALAETHGLGHKAFAWLDPEHFFSIMEFTRV
jgi:cyclopropane fatty-acyl-phospholipid synthase-like methyltransferase